jgi:hypothetical protein
MHALSWFEPAIPAIERPQTYALDRTATRIGEQLLYNIKSETFIWNIFNVKNIEQVKGCYM